jgi:hypothetical protein
MTTILLHAAVSIPPQESYIKKKIACCSNSKDSCHYAVNPLVIVIAFVSDETASELFKSSSHPFVCQKRKMPKFFLRFFEINCCEIDTTAAELLS